MKGRLTTEMCNDGYEQIYKCTKCTVAAKQICFGEFCSTTEVELRVYQYHC